MCVGVLCRFGLGCIVFFLGGIVFLLGMVGLFGRGGWGVCPLFCVRCYRWISVAAMCGMIVILSWVKRIFTWWTDWCFIAFVSSCIRCSILFRCRIISSLIIVCLGNGFCCIVCSGFFVRGRIVCMGRCLLFACVGISRLLCSGVRIASIVFVSCVFFDEINTVGLVVGY